MIGAREPMDPVRFRRIKALFAVLSEFPADERRGLLEDLCLDDPLVRRVVAELLEENELP